MDAEAVFTLVISGCALAVSFTAIVLSIIAARTNHLHAVTKTAIEVTEVALQVEAEARKLLRKQHKKYPTDFDRESKTNEEIAKHQKDAADAIKAMSKILEDEPEEEMQRVKLHQLQQELGVVLHGKYELQKIHDRIRDKQSN